MITVLGFVKYFNPKLSSDSNKFSAQNLMQIKYVHDSSVISKCLCGEKISFPK